MWELFFAKFSEPGFECEHGELGNNEDLQDVASFLNSKQKHPIKTILANETQNLGQIYLFIVILFSSLCYDIEIELNGLLYAMGHSKSVA